MLRRVAGFSAWFPYWLRLGIATYRCDSIPSGASVLGPKLPRMSFIETSAIASSLRLAPHHNSDVVRFGELVLVIAGHGEFLSIRRQFTCFRHMLPAVTL